MTLVGYVAPGFRLEAFTCPFCGVYAHFLWRVTLSAEGQGYSKGHSMEALCSHCQGITIWHTETQSIIWPRDSGNAPLPNPDMPEDVKGDYSEARSICNASPRGSAALLRLSIQKLCKHLGGKGENINDDIAGLVKQGLPVDVQQALDIVRVTGNNAVHPGEMQLDDDANTVNSLFELVNLIVENRISQAKRIKQLYSNLPQTALDGIVKRDGATARRHPKSD